jgi:GH18 family chitinase
MGWNDPSVPRGNIGAFRILKQMHPHLKIAFSLGGWTLSE